MHIAFCWLYAAAAIAAAEFCLMWLLDDCTNDFKVLIFAEDDGNAAGVMACEDWCGCCLFSET